MPNHITSRIEIKGEPAQVDSFIQAYSTYYPESFRMTHDDEQFICEDSEGKFCGWYNEKTNTFMFSADRTEVTGMPEGFRKEVRPAWQHFPDFEKILPPPNDPAYRDEPSQESARHSKSWWHTWNVENWGTKWNSYGCKKESDSIFIFQTAWSGVPDLIKKMSKDFPDVEIVYDYFDEDTGANTGSFVFKRGKAIRGYKPVNYAAEAYEIIFKVEPERRNDFVFENDEYKYIDQE